MRLFARARKRVAPWSPGYYPSIEDASPEQQRSYNWLVEELDKGRTPDIAGNDSYLFALTYQILAAFAEQYDYAGLTTWFDRMRTGYPNSKVVEYLDMWQSDAALVTGHWDDAWQFKRRSRLDVHYILTVRRKCSSTTLHSLDMQALLLSDNGLTEWGRKRMARVGEVVEQLLSEKHAKAGMNLIDAFCKEYAWRPLSEQDLDRIADECEYLVGVRKLRNAYKRQPRHAVTERQLFSGVLMPFKETSSSLDVGELVMRIRASGPVVKLTSVSPAIELAALAQCRLLMREAENQVRREEGLPAIGEGWVSETELYQLVARSFPKVSVRQHARPEWLAPQHLDVFLPQHNVALEYQGSQHLEPVDYFGGESAFKRQQKRDARKKRLCAKNDCTLIYVYQDYVPETVLAQVEDALRAHQEPRGET